MYKLFKLILVLLIIDMSFVCAEKNNFVQIENIKNYVGIYQNVLSTNVYLDNNGVLKYISYDFSYTYDPKDIVDIEYLDKKYNLDNQALLLKSDKYILTKNGYKDVDFFNNGEFQFIYKDTNIHRYLYQDINFTNYNRDIVLKKLKTIEIVTEQITKNAITNDDKISSIYKRFTTNIEYHKESYKRLKNGLDTNNGYWNSGLGTFENKQGVCYGFTTLMYYMLKFAGIDSVIYNGNVFFPELNRSVYHSWIKIGNDYYDPSLDSKVSQDQWNRYKLPYEIMYANRSNSVRFSISQSDLSKKYCELASQYYKFRYNLLYPYNNYYEKGISCEVTFDIDLMKKLVKDYYMVDNNFEFKENGNKYKLIIDGYQRINSDLNWYLKNLDVGKQVLFKKEKIYYISLNGFYIQADNLYKEKISMKEPDNFKVDQVKLEIHEKPPEPKESKGKLINDNTIDTKKFLDVYNKTQLLINDNKSKKFIEIDFDNDLDVLETQLQLYLKLNQFTLFSNKLSQLKGVILDKYGLSKYKLLLERKINLFKNKIENTKSVKKKIFNVLKVEKSNLKKGVYLYIYFSLY